MLSPGARAPVGLRGPAAARRLQQLGTFAEFAEPQPKAQPSLPSPQKAREGEAPFTIKALPASGQPQPQPPGARARALGRKGSPAGRSSRAAGVGGAQPRL